MLWYRGIIERFCAFVKIRSDSDKIKGRFERDYCHGRGVMSIIERMGELRR